MSILYEVMIEDVLLRQVIADREAQLAVLPVGDERRVPLADELTRLYLNQGRLVRLHQILIRRKHGLSPDNTNE